MFALLTTPCPSATPFTHFPDHEDIPMASYERLLPEDKHLITKRYTQRIERQNLNLRTWIKRLARKTICFSKSIEIHDKVIGTCIDRRFFNFFKS